MAISVREEGPKINIVAVLITLVVIVSVFGLVYVLLFRSPELVDVVLPQSLKGTENVSSITFEPETVLQSGKFKALQKYGADAPESVAGKRNPFLP